MGSSGTASKKVESQRFGGYYNPGRTIGQGAYAVVKLCTHSPSCAQYAVKVFDKTRSSWESRKKLVYREVKLMERICKNHENICSFIEYVDSPQQLHLVIEEVVFFPELSFGSDFRYDGGPGRALVTGVLLNSSV